MKDDKQEEGKSKDDGELEDGAGRTLLPFSIRGHSRPSDFPTVRIIRSIWWSHAYQKITSPQSWYFQVYLKPFL